MHRFAFVFVLALLGAAAQAAPSKAETMTSSDARPKLVIIGASYALDWGVPELPGFRTVVNKGVGGQESTPVRERFERDALAEQPDAVLIWGHINDIFRAPRDQMAQAKERAQENYRWMHERARAAGVEVILATEVTMTVGDSWRDEIMAFIGKLRGRENYRVMINGHVKDVNEWLRKYAAEHRLRLIDLEQAVDSGNGSRRAEFTQEDGSHISPAGYEAISRHAAAALAKR
jgi:lysophospholipase L1-like esterase